MSDRSGLSHFRVLFEAALQDYEKQTGITLAKHPLAEQLQDCSSVESITALLHKQTQAFSEFIGSDKITKLFKNTVSILYVLSNIADLGRSINLVCPKAQSRILRL
jgi:fungal STAND N-terminal Goodbye domain